MAKGATSKGAFTTEIASIAVDTEITEGTFDSVVLEVWDVDSLALQGVAKGGHANAGGQVVFRLLASLDGVEFDTVYFHEHRITLNGTTAVIGPAEVIDVSGIHSLKLEKIKNEDIQANCTATLVNLNWSKGYGSDRW